MECGAGGAVATDRSSVPLRTTTCVNLCEGITYGRRTRAHLRGFRPLARAWRLVCYLCAVGASVIWLQRFFSRFFSQPDVRSSLSGSARVDGAGWESGNKCRMTCRQSCAGARDHERRITADLRRGVACRVRPAAGAPHARATAHELTQTAEYSAPRTADTTARASRERTEWDVYVDDREPADRFPFAWGIGCHGSVRTAERLAARLASPIDVTYRAVSSWARHEL